MYALFQSKDDGCTLEFPDFDTMLAILHENWPVLKSKHNLVVGHKKHKDKKIIDDQSLREVLGMAWQQRKISTPSLTCRSI